MAANICHLNKEKHNFCFAFSACAILLIAITEFQFQRQGVTLMTSRIPTPAGQHQDDIQLISCFGLLIYQNLPVIALFIDTNWFKTSEKN